MLYIVHQTISSIQNRFEHFQKYRNIFDFLFNFNKLKSLDDDALKKYCLNLACVLKNNISSNIDGLDLLAKLKVLTEILQAEENNTVDVLNYIKRLDSFPNACITYRFLLTIASA